tara:strand:- start:87 stop:398 length:312 start_codon:yes stop_codon:yes gene_type:complete
MKEKKIYFVYKFTNNPNPNETYKKLERSFGEGYLFDRKHPNAKEKSTRANIRKLFTKDMKEGKFDIVIVDTSYGKGRFMKEEIALAKKLKIPVKEVNLNKNSV